jgi:hypothetical protein
MLHSQRFAYKTITLSPVHAADRYFNFSGTGGCIKKDYLQTLTFPPAFPACAEDSAGRPVLLSEIHRTSNKI